MEINAAILSFTLYLNSVQFVCTSRLLHVSFAAFCTILVLKLVGLSLMVASDHSIPLDYRFNEATAYRSAKEVYGKNLTVFVTYRLIECNHKKLFCLSV